MKTLILALCTLLINSTAIAADKNAAPVEISNAYAFATSAGQRNGAIFLEITNIGEEDVRLEAISAAVSDIIELHSTEFLGDVMQMRKVEFYDIPAGETLTLKPMGNHIMLIGLNDVLKQDQKFPISLTFKDYDAITAEVAVVPPGEKHEHANHQ